MPLSEEEPATLFLSPYRLRSLTDEDVMVVLRMGCNDAVALLFEMHSPVVFRIARAILRDDGEAEEPVQRVFPNRFKAVHQFSSERGTLKTWVRQYANHRCIDRRRHLQANGFYKSSCGTSPASACWPQARALTKKQLLNHESSAGVL